MDFGDGSFHVANLASYEKCSSWFLKHESMLSWIAESVEEAQWTEGKIYCPKCKSRIGAFDFIHGIQCNCGRFTIPAIWIQKSRVDHIFPKSQLVNLDIRKPISTKPSAHADNNLVVQNAIELRDGNVHGLDNTCACSEQTGDKNEGQDSHRNSGQAAFLAHTSLQSFSGESSSTSCNQCKQNWNVQYLREPRATEDVKNSVGDEDKKRQRLAATCSCVCIFNVNQAMGTCSSATKTAQIKSNEESLLNQRSKRIRKGRHRSRIHQDDNLDSHVQTITEQQVPGAAANKNTFSCLTVDEGIGDTQDAIPEIQDRHCCAVCLDLLYEPFKCSCDHVFCDPCLRQLNFRTGKQGTIRCPLCRQIVEHVTPATGIRNEIRNTYDSHILRKREKPERRAPYRKWPLPSSRSPSQRAVSRTQRRVTLPCIICIFLVSACVYSLVMIAVLSIVTDGIKTDKINLKGLGSP